MAESQVQCLRDDHVNEKVTENMVQFYYSEDQRRLLEVLVSDGAQAYREHAKKHSLKDFLSTKELCDLQAGWKEYETESPNNNKKGAKKEAKESPSLAYWPDLSDTQIPPLDLGWPENGFYRGANKMLVYTHPPKENAPTIKAVIRELIQRAKKVIAIVVDFFTDREVFRDVLDAAEKRRVPVYIILGEEGVKHFLEMCERMQVTSYMLRNLRVRYVTGVGFYLPSGRISGSLSHKYIMVDGDQVAFGSFRFTWSSFRMDRSIMTYMSGQFTEPFDIEFRELYAITEEVNLYNALSLPDCRPSAMLSASTSSTVARKLINPKYSLVVGRGQAPGEMLRFGTPKPPTTAKEGEETESESEKRMVQFLNDLISIEQEIPEKVKLDDLPKSITHPKKEAEKGSPNFARSSKRFTKLFKKSPPLNQDKEKVLEGDFVVVEKPKRDTKYSLRSRSNQDLRSSGNQSPISTKSERPKMDKCLLS